MMSKPGQQAITIYILAKISQSKGNQATKFGQVIQGTKINIFLQKSCRKSICSRLLFVFLKNLYMRLKQVVCTLVSKYVDSSQLGLQ